MDTKALLLTFFDAENRRDWDLYRKFIDRNIIWTLISNGKEKVIIGADNYVAYMKSFYEKCDDTFEVENFCVSNSGARIAAVLRNNLNERSCDIFDFADGVIIREYEFTLD